MSMASTWTQALNIFPCVELIHQNYNKLCLLKIPILHIDLLFLKKIIYLKIGQFLFLFPPSYSITKY